MRIVKKVERKVEELTAMECDCCGTVYNVTKRHTRDTTELYEFVTINFTGGYGSIFGDMNEYECDLCQHCVSKLLGKVLRLKAVHQ